MFPEKTIIHGRVHSALVAIAVPESATEERSALEFRLFILVVIAIISAEHCAVVVGHWVAGVARVPGHQQLIVVTLRQHSERAVLGEIPRAVLASLQVELQLEVAVHCQPTEHVVADPVVVAAWVTKSHSVLRPRTFEELRPVNVLLDQQRSAGSYRTHINVVNCLTISLLLIVINTKNCSLSIVLTATDQKRQKSLNRSYYPPSHCLNVNVMMSNMTFFDDFCGFWSVAVNTMDKLQFLVLIIVKKLNSLKYLVRTTVAESHN